MNQYRVRNTGTLGIFLEEKYCENVGFWGRYAFSTLLANILNFHPAFKNIPFLTVI